MEVTACRYLTPLGLLITNTRAIHVKITHFDNVRISVAVDFDGLRGVTASRKIVLVRPIKILRTDYKTANLLELPNAVAGRHAPTISLL